MAEKFCLLTVSSSRDLSSDISGSILEQHIGCDTIFDRKIVRDNCYEIRAVVSAWIVQPEVGYIVVSGGTGFTADDVTPEALTPLFDKLIPGFGEVFRMLSLAQVGIAALHSRAIAGVANGKTIFAMPGSPKACELAWERLIRPMTRPDPKDQGFCHWQSLQTRM